MILFVLRQGQSWRNMWDWSVFRVPFQEAFANPCPDVLPLRLARFKLYGYFCLIRVLWLHESNLNCYWRAIHPTHNPRWPQLVRLGWRVHLKGHRPAAGGCRRALSLGDRNGGVLFMPPACGDRKAHLLSKISNFWISFLY